MVVLLSITSVERTIVLSTPHKALCVIGKGTEEHSETLLTTGTCYPAPLNCENSPWHALGSGRLTLYQTNHGHDSAVTSYSGNICKRQICHLLFGNCKTCINIVCFMPVGLCAQSISGCFTD